MHSLSFYTYSSYLEAHSLPCTRLNCSYFSSGQVSTKKKAPRVQHKLKKKEKPMKVLKGGRLDLDAEHETSLVKIVR